MLETWTCEEVSDLKRPLDAIRRTHSNKLVRHTYTQGKSSLNDNWSRRHREALTLCSASDAADHMLFDVLAGLGAELRERLCGVVVVELVRAAGYLQLACARLARPRSEGEARGRAHLVPQLFDGATESQINDKSTRSPDDVFCAGPRRKRELRSRRRRANAKVDQ